MLHAMLALPIQAHDLPIVAIGIVLLGVVIVGAVRWPSMAAGAVIVLAPFHKVAVAVTDKAIARIDDPAAAAGDYPTFLSRVYSIDGLVIGGLLVGTVAGVLWRRRHRSDLQAAGSSSPERWRDAGLLWAAVIAVGYVAVTAAVMTHSNVSRGAGFALMLAGAGPALMLVFYLADPSQATRRVVLAGVVLAGAATGAYCLLEQWQPAVRGFHPELNGPFYELSGGNGYRSGSLLASPFEVGFYLAAISPIAAVAVVRSRGWARAASTVALVLIAAGITVTFTRSAYVGAAIGVLITLGLMIQRLNRRRIIVGAVAIAAVAAATIFVARSSLPLFSHGGSNSEHWAAIRGDLSLIREQPLGYGLGVLDTIGQNFDPNALSQPSSENLILGKGVQGGIPEMAAYLLTLVVVIVTLMARTLAARVAADREGVTLCAMAVGATVAILAAGMFLAMEDVSHLAVVWGLTGMAFAATRVRVVSAASETTETPIVKASRRGDPVILRGSGQPSRAMRPVSAFIDDPAQPEPE